MKQTRSTVLGAITQILALLALIVLYALIVTRGRPLDWLP
jgi:hypothetical protein